MDIPEEFKTDAWWRNSKVDLEALAEKYEKEWEEEVSLIQIAGA
jgi:hypothetical protein